MAIKGIIFDMDGTLVESFLDFAQIRRDMGIGKKAPILESIDQTSCLVTKKKWLSIVERHEQVGAEKSYFYPGVLDFLTTYSKDIKFSICTRNSKKIVKETLKQHLHFFGPIVSREDVREQKPHPEGVKMIQELWRLKAEEILFVGDSAMDIQSGKMTGVKTALINQKNKRIEEDQDWEFKSFLEFKTKFKPLFLPSPHVSTET